MPDERVHTGETVIAVLKRADGQKTVIKEDSLNEQLKRLEKCLKQLKSNLEKNF